MKANKFFKSVLLAAILLIGGNAWAETATLQLSGSIKFGTNNGSQLTQDGITWTVATTQGAIQNSYQSNYSGQQFGTGKAPWLGSFSATIAGATITKIEVVANTGGSATLDVTVGESAFGSAQEVIKRSGTTPDTYTFEGESSGEIIVLVSNTSAAFYLNSIIVTYSLPIPAVATPTFTPSPGTYTEAQNVEITCATEGATIYYTTNGDDPTATSTEYSGAIPVSTTTTLKAIAIKGGESSNIASATYTILTIQQATIEDFLAASESEDVYYELTGRMSNITNTTYGNFDLTDATGTVYVYGLTATMQISNDKSFASLGLAEGDVITILHIL